MNKKINKSNIIIRYIYINIMLVVYRKFNNINIVYYV